MNQSFLVQLPLLFFSIILHEYAHGAVAEKYGDDTARLMGRLTFNPIAHIDPMGTIVLPLICFLTNVPMFGWAKPVPVNPARLEQRPMSLILVAAAGPVSNIFLACLASAGLWALARLAPGSEVTPVLMKLFHFAVIMNLYLAVFNLLPIHPLDGSKVLAGLLPPRWSYTYEGLAPYGFMIIMILMMTGLFGYIVTPVVYWLYKFLV
ncbi:MAG: site-2 protease family protein, partial [Elusimicrobiota bacterium]